MPRQRPASGRAKSGYARDAERRSLLRRALSRPGVTVAGAAFAALMTGIVVNAVMFQKDHHPSPLFGSASASAPVKAAALDPPLPPRSDPAPVPATAPDPVQQLVAAPAPARPSHPSIAGRQAHAAAPKKPAPSSQHHKDPIGQLLGQSDAPAEPNHKAADHHPKAAHQAGL